MNFEFLVNVPLLLQNLYRFLYILMEVLPFLRIIHKIFRADQGNGDGAFGSPEFE